jgi:hypothetical protein
MDLLQTHKQKHKDTHKENGLAFELKPREKRPHEDATNEFGSVCNPDQQRYIYCR